MATIKLDLKQFLVNSSDGFDFFGHARKNSDFRFAKANCEVDSYKTSARLVYTKEKHRAKRIITQQLTASGKPSKKPPIVQNIPGHVRWRIYAIPNVIVKMIEKQGQKIVQQKNHFNIENK